MTLNKKYLQGCVSRSVSAQKGAETRRKNKEQERLKDDYKVRYNPIKIMLETDIKKMHEKDARELNK